MSLSEYTELKEAVAEYFRCLDQWAEQHALADGDVGMGDETINSQVRAHADEACDIAERHLKNLAGLNGGCPECGCTNDSYESFPGQYDAEGNCEAPAYESCSACGFGMEECETCGGTAQVPCANPIDGKGYTECPDCDNGWVAS